MVYHDVSTDISLKVFRRDHDVARIAAIERGLDTFSLGSWYASGVLLSFLVRIACLFRGMYCSGIGFSEGVWSHVDGGAALHEMALV